MITRDAVVAEARTWLDTPFRHQGRLKGVGVDCLGIIVEVGKAIGAVSRSAVNATDYGDATAIDYGHIPKPSRMGDGLRTHLVSISIASAGAGDIVWMAWRTELHPQHLGILTDIGILHAYSGIKKVVEHPLDTAWRARFKAAYRFPGVA